MIAFFFLLCSTFCYAKRIALRKSEIKVHLFYRQRSKWGREKGETDGYSFCWDIEKWIVGHWQWTNCKFCIRILQVLHGIYIIFCSWFEAPIFLSFCFALFSLNCNAACHEHHIHTYIHTQSFFLPHHL